MALLINSFDNMSRRRVGFVLPNELDCYLL